VDRQYRPAPGGDLGGEVVQVDGLAAGACVHQDRAGAGGGDRGEGHDHGDGRQEDLVAGADAVPGQRRVQGGGTRGDGHGTRDARRCRHLGLQGADLAVCGRVGHAVQDAADHPQRRPGRGRAPHDAACPAAGRKRLKSVSGHMLTRSAENRAQSAQGGGLANRVLASAPLMVARRRGVVAAIRSEDGQSHSDPSGSMKASVLPPKQPRTAGTGVVIAGGPWPG
jgi:hypothetical protein